MQARPSKNWPIPFHPPSRYSQGISFASTGNIWDPLYITVGSIFCHNAETPRSSKTKRRGHVRLRMQSMCLANHQKPISTNETATTTTSQPILCLGRRNRRSHKPQLCTAKDEHDLPVEGRNRRLRFRQPIRPKLPQRKIRSCRRAT